MRINLFLPYLRRPKKDPARELARPIRKIALAVLPAAVFSQVGVRVTPGLLRRFLKFVGPTWHSAPIRRITQTLCFLTFLWLFFYVCWPYGVKDVSATMAEREKIHAPTFLLIDPLVAISTSIAARAWVWSLTWAAGILLACVMFPRGFCGYLCPLGSLIDLFDWAIGKRITRFRVTRDGWWVNLKYYILAGVLISSVFGVLLTGFVAAIPVITRGFQLTLAPLQIRALRGPHQNPPINAGQIFSIALFFAVLGLGLFKPRFWCRYVCPSGAVFSVGNLFRATERKVEDTCIKCNKCIEICPFDAIKADFTTRTADCTLCQTCGGVCPTHAIKFVDRWDTVLLKKENDPPTHEINLSRRGLLAGAATGAAAAVGISFLFRGTTVQGAEIIRPPGSVPENEFTELCIRCGECYKACPNNVLQPMGLDAGLKNLWTPQAVSNWSGCEPSCNNCGHVCPTGAIRALPMEEKRAARMGLAIVNTQTCLPHAGKEDCQLCVDECNSAGYRAIEFQRVHMQFDGDGNPIDDTGFLAPVVSSDKCVGCGICQMRCNKINVTTTGKLKDSAIIVHAGDGKDDRISHGPYIQIHIDRQKAKQQQQAPTPYIVDY